MKKTHTLRLSKHLLAALILILTSSAIMADNVFTGGMKSEDLDRYFEVLNLDDKETSYFEKEHWITAAEGRWTGRDVEYRVMVGDTPQDKAHGWVWWINQDRSSFNQKVEQYEKEGYYLVYAQSFLMPDSSARYQGVWHKLIN